MSTVNKGRRWVHQVQVWLNTQGCVTTTRPWMEPGDDITAHHTWVKLSVEAKDHRTLALAGWVDQATRNAPPGAVPVVVAHRQGKAGVDDAYVIMTGRALAQLLAATEGTP